MPASFIFNTSFYVNIPFYEKWEKWLNDTLIPEISGKFPDFDVEIFEVVTPCADDSKTFSVQWRCSDISDTKQLDLFLTDFYHQLPNLFGENVVHFNSIMKKQQ